MAKAARLKVYAAQLGFFETVVATPNQAAALAAWGVHRNLFADGSAAPATDAAAIAAAEAAPGVVLRRPIGSAGAYTTDAAAALDLPNAPKTSKAKRSVKAAPPKPKPDRTALTRAEREVTGARDALEQATREIEERREALDRQARDLRRDFDRHLSLLEKARAKAEAAFVKAGGKL